MLTFTETHDRPTDITVVNIINVSKYVSLTHQTQTPTHNSTPTNTNTTAIKQQNATNKKITPVILKSKTET